MDEACLRGRWREEIDRLRVGCVRSCGLVGHSSEMPGQRVAPAARRPGRGGAAARSLARPSNRRFAPLCSPLFPPNRKQSKIVEMTPVLGQLTMVPPPPPIPPLAAARRPSPSAGASGKDVDGRSSSGGSGKSGGGDRAARRDGDGADDSSLDRLERMYGRLVAEHREWAAQGQQREGAAAQHAGGLAGRARRWAGQPLRHRRRRPWCVGGRHRSIRGRRRPHEGPHEEADGLRRRRRRASRPPPALVLLRPSRWPPSRRRGRRRSRPRRRRLPHPPPPRRRRARAWPAAWRAG